MFLKVTNLKLTLKGILNVLNIYEFKVYDKYKWIIIYNVCCYFKKSFEIDQNIKNIPDCFNNHIVILSTRFLNIVVQEISCFILSTKTQQLTGHFLQLI